MEAGNMTRIPSVSKIIHDGLDTTDKICDALAGEKSL